MELQLKVRIYRNLHKRCWSVLAWQGPDKGLVVSHSKKLCLRDCRFIVHEHGQVKTRQTKRKNVHAFVEGVLSNSNVSGLEAAGRIVYNPYKHRTFRLPTKPVHAIQKVMFSDNGQVHGWSKI